MTTRQKRLVVFGALVVIVLGCAVVFFYSRPSKQTYDAPKAKTDPAVATISEDATPGPIAEQARPVVNEGIPGPKSGRENLLDNPEVLEQLTHRQKGASVESETKRNADIAEKAKALNSRLIDKLELLRERREVASGAERDRLDKIILKLEENLNARGKRITPVERSTQRSELQD